MSEAEIKNQLTEAEAAASNNPSNPGAEPEVQESEVKRSYDRSKEGRIAAIDKKIEALQAKRQAIFDAPESVSKPKAEPVEVNVGDTVNVEIGRGETRRTVSGQVLAVFENKVGQRKVKVLAGEGVDAQLVEAFATGISKPEQEQQAQQYDENGAVVEV